MDSDIEQRFLAMEDRIDKVRDVATSTNLLSQSNAQTIRDNLLPLVGAVKDTSRDVDEVRTEIADAIQKALAPVLVEMKEHGSKLDKVDGGLTFMQVAGGVAAALITLAIAAYGLWSR